MSLLFFQYRWLSEYLSSITTERECCKRVYTELAEVKNSVIILCNIRKIPYVSANTHLERLYA